MRDKTLIIGPRNNKKYKSNTGGIVVLFEDWIEYCDNHNIDYIAIDSNKKNYNNIFVAYFSIIRQLLKNIRKTSSVFLHGTLKDYLYILPIIILLAKVNNKKIHLRKFAGNFDQAYNNCGFIKKYIFSWVLRSSDVLFWETKNLVTFGKEYNANSYWFPNVRKHTKQRRIDGVYQKRFVYVSRVQKAKGIDYLLGCFKKLDPSYTLDIYGPLDDGYKPEDLTGTNVRYLGSLSNDEVLVTLTQYDVLLLPTTWKTEGYPGIIIEAYSVGIPVISTKIGGIPEIVEHNYNGILIEPHNSDELLSAIVSFNKDNYPTYSDNALASFSDFDSEVVCNYIIANLSK